MDIGALRFNNSMLDYYTVKKKIPNDIYETDNRFMSIFR